ncbi:unnamed protein product [Phaedon cochleariae]|uniref:C2H2-type domain-containing protein n=1 Tax=Phaedon cochleariae TaxID=80249 RepID=A0A9N9X2J1_PHACE|nr:unnamed protein product [Phaedon cochleariae]
MLPVWSGASTRAGRFISVPRGGGYRKRDQTRGDSAYQADSSLKSQEGNDRNMRNNDRAPPLRGRLPGGQHRERDVAEVVDLEEYVCEHCQRPFVTKVGRSQHVRRAHPVEYNREIVVDRAKARWSEEEARVMARAEAEATVAQVRFMNLNLVEAMPDRTLDSIKGQRRKAEYQDLVRQYVADLTARAATPDSESSSDPEPLSPEAEVPVGEKFFRAIDQLAESIDWVALGDQHGGLRELIGECRRRGISDPLLQLAEFIPHLRLRRLLRLRASSVAHVVACAGGAMVDCQISWCRARLANVPRPESADGLKAYWARLWHHAVDGADLSHIAESGLGPCELTVQSYEGHTRATRGPRCHVSCGLSGD